MALESDSYRDLLDLAKQGETAPLLALRPVDLARSVGGELEPKLLQLQSAPTLLKNEEVEVGAYGLAAALLIALAIVASSALAPAPVDPLSF